MINDSYAQPFIYSLRDGLIDKGYHYEVITVGGQRYKKYVAPNGWVWFSRNSFYDYPFVSYTARLVSKEKPLSYVYAKEYGINVADYLCTSDFEQAYSFMSSHDRIVVKPADGSGGSRVTVNVCDRSGLEKALHEATSSEGLDPIIQEQYDGDEIRMTVMNGKVLSSIWRQTPRITGDGTSTLLELLVKENAQRAQLVFPTLKYPQLDDALMQIEPSAYASVPSKGETVILGQASMISKGASFIGISDSLHDSYKDIAIMLANALNSPMLVVDLMVQKFTAPAAPDNYTFLEFNTSPSIRGYTSLRSGDRPDVARAFIEEIDKYAAQPL